MLPVRRVCIPPQVKHFCHWPPLVPSHACMLANVAVHLGIDSDRLVLPAGCSLPPVGLHSKTRNTT